ncbi:flagellar basal body-associated FliL family protein [Acidithiobacillus sulfuriphilus]|uniref:Flagellar protein FliL n=2 Tax=Acidithiobacillus sulfuriphilus TaxID=1867749 RepID=A0A3M8QSQ2_9PROT|nr:flagellar basal body-associated FliL family protein [Acidithiobacillus sulfuriphilus]RNF59228.1 flagellar biosynthesis protein FliL [Acidithiobacillus sulfuriphilus]
MAEGKKSGKGRLILIILVVVAILAGAGGAAWWFLLRPHAVPSAAEVAQKKLQDTKFIDLGSLVTNLQTSDGSTHYIQVEIQLKTFDPNVAEEVKTFMPEIRNAILTLLASQQADKVSEPAVREQLRQQIQEAVNRILETSGGALKAPVKTVTPPIAAVYFASFVVQ